MSTMYTPYVKIDFDQIKIFECVGTGRFGSVHRAEWDGKTVAVKKIVCFENEANLLASLRHKNIITFFGACTNAPNSFLVTEYAEHGSLYEFLIENELDYHRIVTWAAEIASGMDYLHDGASHERIMHRDLKSLNVLVTGTYVLKICDFGSSRALGTETNCNTYAGTYKWMAPEMIRPGPVTEMCDVWSYGVILWELMTQEIPYGDMDGVAVAWQVAAQGLRLPIPEACPSEFAALMKQCMTDAPEMRPPFSRILQLLDRMKQDGNMDVQWQAFFQDRELWKGEIDAVIDSYKQLETDFNRLSLKWSEVERKEHVLRRREMALQQYLESQSFMSVTSSPLSPIRRDGVGSEVTGWTEEDVANWISVLPNGLDKYKSTMLENNINGSILIMLNHDNMLNALNIKSFGHREMLLNEISKIQKSTEFPPLLKAQSRTSQADSAIEFDITIRGQYYSDAQEWQVWVDPPEQSDHIAQVVFDITSDVAQDTDKQTRVKLPYTIKTKCPPGQKKEINIAITYKTTYQRKTTKKNFLLDTRRPRFSADVRVKLTVKETRRHLISSLASVYPEMPFQVSSASSTSDQSLGGSINISSSSSRRADKR
eukprot:m.212479 g.212479  ORF g.212479 m.212479 type:complete len:598 (-) comp20490_c0_seq1:198-1991(-)